MGGFLTSALSIRDANLAVRSAERRENLAAQIRAFGEQFPPWKFIDFEIRKTHIEIILEHPTRRCAAARENPLYRRRLVLYPDDLETATRTPNGIKRVVERFRRGLETAIDDGPAGGT